MNFRADHPGKIDLHTHSVHSDGSLTPSEIVQRAVAAGVGTLSLTDHDSIAGVEEARHAASQAGIQLVPGVELSAYFDDREIHVLGYFIDIDEPRLGLYLARFVAARRERILEMIERLRSQGAEVRPQDVLPPEGGYVGRPHLARVLIETGQAESIRDVYERYLGPHCPAYVPKYELRAHESFELIQGAGGLAILAHPARRFSAETILELQRLGLDGLEVYHAQQGKGTTRWVRRLARENGFLVSGGSDFHGEAVRADVHIAQSRLPRPYFSEMLDALRERRRESPRDAGRELPSSSTLPPRAGGDES
jgi:predicted metal-dependent phosphoesterase TrpH